ncbi:hypothetical protein F2Q68_00037040 [Brassica cretica]|uniref:F-box domain-containing protein n=2 Tax=Brassica cretica TaxID=69181 RepID=A0A8S9H7J8_BRACR|nr:hypothetical protein F2Q68_00037040 [Brassica cretica]KAF3487644.1 hypothetical protein F2Q69_00056806 [Brassica cretica]KAF3597028.1 hypothetical protein DY000_02026689 [Brassica cretica]
MDKVSPFPDDLLLKILSYLPTNEVRITSVLSKRWRSLWMLLPKLELWQFQYGNIRKLLPIC